MQTLIAVLSKPAGRKTRDWCLYARLSCGRLSRLVAHIWYGTRWCFSFASCDSTWSAVSQGRSHSKNFVRGQIFLLKRATVFGSGHHVSKHKTTTYARMLGWKRPLCPSPGFVNAVSDVSENTALVICVWRKHRQIALYQRSSFGCDALCHQMFWMRVYHLCGTTIASVFPTAHFLTWTH